MVAVAVVLVSACVLMNRILLVIALLVAVVVVAVECPVCRSCFPHWSDPYHALSHWDALRVLGGSSSRLLGLVLDEAAPLSNVTDLDVAEDAEGGIQGVVVESSEPRDLNTPRGVDVVAS